jgi:hypothetical protein
MGPALSQARGFGYVTQTTFKTTVALRSLLSAAGWAAVNAPTTRAPLPVPPSAIRPGPIRVAPPEGRCGSARKRRCVRRGREARDVDGCRASCVRERNGTRGQTGRAGVRQLKLARVYGERGGAPPREDGAPDAEVGAALEVAASALNIRMHLREHVDRTQRAACGSRPFFSLVFFSFLLFFLANWCPPKKNVLAIPLRKIKTEMLPKQKPAPKLEGAESDVVAFVAQSSTGGVASRARCASFDNAPRRTARGMVQRARVVVSGSDGGPVVARLVPDARNAMLLSVRVPAATTRVAGRYEYRYTVTYAGQQQSGALAIHVCTEGEMRAIGRLRRLELAGSFDSLNVPSTDAGNEPRTFVKCQLRCAAVTPEELQLPAVRAFIQGEMDKVHMELGDARIRLTDNNKDDRLRVSFAVANARTAVAELEVAFRGGTPPEGVPYTVSYDGRACGGGSVLVEARERALVLTCMEHRPPDGSVARALSRLRCDVDRYDCVALAGASIGIVGGTIFAYSGTGEPDGANADIFKYVEGEWDWVFLEHVVMSARLHATTMAVVIDHLRCDCYNAYYGTDYHDGDDVRSRPGSIAKHFVNLRNACKYIDIALGDDGAHVVGLLMDVDGALVADPDGEVEAHYYMPTVERGLRYGQTAGVFPTYLEVMRNNLSQGDWSVEEENKKTVAAWNEKWIEYGFDVHESDRQATIGAILNAYENETPKHLEGMVENGFHASFKAYLQSVESHFGDDVSEGMFDPPQMLTGMKKSPYRIATLRDVPYVMITGGEDLKGLLANAKTHAADLAVRRAELKKWYPPEHFQTVDWSTASMATLDSYAKARVRRIEAIRDELTKNPRKHPSLTMTRQGTVDPTKISGLSDALNHYDDYGLSRIQDDIGDGKWKYVPAVPAATLAAKRAQLKVWYPSNSFDWQDEAAIEKKWKDKRGADLANHIVKNLWASSSPFAYLVVQGNTVGLKEKIAKLDEDTVSDMLKWMPS